MGIFDGIQGIEIIDCGEPLLLLDPKEFVLEPMYYKMGLSDTPEMKLRCEVIARLRQAQEVLQSGYRLKIWDGFRTIATQTLLYDGYFRDLKKAHPGWSDSKIDEAVQIFVAPPSRDPKMPAPHNTGGAVDLTLVDADGVEIEMGSGFDEFHPRSFTDHYKSGKFYENRKLLRDAMEEFGFVNYVGEWWHFSYGDQNWALRHKEKCAIYGSKELKKL